MKKLILLTTLLSLFAANCLAGTYKWIDKEGKVHYSSTPPAEADIKATKIKTHTKPSSSQQEEIKAFEDFKAKEKEEALQEIKTKEELAKEEERKAIKLKNCNTAKQKLASYTDNLKIRYQKENGEWAYMSDEVRQQRAKTAQEDVDLYCNED